MLKKHFKKILLQKTRLFFSSEMNSPLTAYEILNLSPTSSSTEIRKRYYELVKKTHPDVSREDFDGKRFQEIMKAYECISNEEKRIKYNDSIGLSGLRHKSGESESVFENDEQYDFFIAKNTVAKKHEFEIDNFLSASDFHEQISQKEKIFAISKLVFSFWFYCSLTAIFGSVVADGVARRKGQTDELDQQDYEDEKKSGIVHINVGLNIF